MISRTRFLSVILLGSLSLAAGLLVFAQEPKTSDPKTSDPKTEPKPETKAEKKPEEAGLSADYGFLPVELFKLSSRISNLTARDLNGDGRKDLLVVDNGESRLELLLARDRKPTEPPAEKLEVNDLTDSWRFDRRKLPVSHKVEALATPDFNGDGRADLCYLGDNRLTIMLGDDKSKWDRVRERRISDQVLPIAWRIASGDLDADGCDDLVILGDGETLIIRGSADASLERLERLPNTTNKFSYIWVKDLDGDARLDLLYLATDDESRALVARFQDNAKKFGPEYRLELPAPRAFEMAELDGRPGVEVLAIDAKTSRVKMYRINPAREKSDAPTSPLVQFGFGPRKGTAGGQFLSTGDLNGDGLMDVVTVDGDAALMGVYLQDAKSGLGQAQAFPGLTGIRGLCVADIDGDKQAEVIVASEREKMISISRWRDGRLSFPESLPTVDTPLALCLGDFDGSGKWEIAYISSNRTSGAASYALRKLSYRDQAWHAGDFNGMDSIALDKLRTAPAEMLAIDADRDGRSDLMVLSNNAPLLFLATSARGVPAVVEAGSARLGNVSPGRVTLGQLDGQAILIADKNFTRRVKLDAKSQWTVVDQYNADNPEAVIAGTAILDLDADGQSEIVLVDTGTRRLRFLRKRDGVYRPWKDLEIGNFGYQSLATGDFNGDGKNDLLLFGPEKFGIVYTGKSGPVLEQTGGFESELRDVRLTDLAAGDLGGGNEPEIALVDTGKYRIELLTLRDSIWKSALSFKVFEVVQSGAGGGEPRELVVADVTGDGLEDLVLMVHDRLLLYTQDSGKPAESSATSEPVQATPPND